MNTDPQTQPQLDIRTAISDKSQILKTAAINVNFTIKHQRRFDLIKLMQENEPDITMVTETKLNPSHKLNIDGYEIIRTDRPGSNQGGGIAIIIKTKLISTQLQPRILSTTKLLNTH